MIKFEKVSKIYSSRCADGEKITALDNVSFEIKAKEFVFLTGCSGAGKTTLLKLLLAEEKASHGQIFFAGKEIGQLSSAEVPHLRRRIGAVFQDYKLLPSKTIFENISYVMQATGFPDYDIARDIPKVLEIVGLGDRSNHFPAELSGGECQRVAIARALVHRPEVILADEPTGNLDPYNTMEIIRLLLKIQEMGTTVVLATHDREIINSSRKRVITLEKGKVIRDEEAGRFVL